MNSSLCIGKTKKLRLIFTIINYASARFFKLCLKAFSNISCFLKIVAEAKVLCPDFDLKRGISRVMLFLVCHICFS